MKLAYFSPLSPKHSGIADYSEELLPYLAQHAEIDLFVDGFTPGNNAITQAFEVFDYQRNPSILGTLSDYDATLYHIGNDHRYHAGICSTLRKHPGVAVFHDFALQDFFLGLAQEERSPAIYLDELQACHGEQERIRAARNMNRGAAPPQAQAPIEFPLNCRLARAAEGIIVHSEWSRVRLAANTPGTPITRINHHITDKAATSQPRWENARSGDTVNIASFGLITRGKGIERALRALAKLRDQFDFHYTLVGRPDDYPELPHEIRRLGLDDRVTITGYVSLPEFEQHMATTDIAINLRERPVGATSGSLCRIMAAGVAAIVSNVGSFSEVPNDAVVKINHDEHADALLEAYLAKLMADSSLRTRLGANARAHVLEHHRIDASAGRYISFIREVIDRRPRRQFIQSVTAEISAIGIPRNGDALLQSVASEVALLTPFDVRQASACRPERQTRVCRTERVPKLEGIDYKRAAVEYLGRLNPERQHHLRTKPFYNLANKPAKYKGDGMDEDSHRHFCDFANLALNLALPAGARVLDVGCGSGWLSEYLARLGYRVKGIDISPDLIAMSEERVARVPYGVDHETPLQCSFAVHDIERAVLEEKFDLIICYDSLHHFEDERAVMKHLAEMLDVGGMLFILEGDKPPDDSTTADELRQVMREFGTLESPLNHDYLRALLTGNGFAIVGDYISVNGLFERERLENDGKSLPLKTIATDYHYLTAMKVVAGESAQAVPDSKKPGVLRAEISRIDQQLLSVSCGEMIEVPITITNSGDTLWLTGQTVRAGLVMPALRIFDQQGTLVNELHGHPMLPRAIAPGQSCTVNLECPAPSEPGRYTAKVDLVDQHICWFEQAGSQPLVFTFEAK